MPLIRRIPKRGFNNTRHATVYIPVNVGQLNRFADGTQVNEAVLRETGLVNGRGSGVKILATGKLERRLTVVVHAFSAAAKAQIEALGGTVEVVGKAQA